MTTFVSEDTMIVATEDQMEAWCPKGKENAFVKQGREKW